MTCSKCLQDGPEGKFCARCGHPQGALDCPTCGFPTPKGGKFCQRCGAAGRQSAERPTATPPASVRQPTAGYVRPAPPRVAASSGRRTPAVLASALVLAILTCGGLGIGLAAVIQERDEWFTLADQRYGELNKAKAEITKAEADMQTATQKLTQAQSNIKTLETRVSQLANEKAKAQDAAAQSAVNTQALLEVTQAAARVTALTTDCMDYQDQWTDIIVNIGRGYTYNSYQLDGFISDMAATCGQAKSSADALQRLVRGL